MWESKVDANVYASQLSKTKPLALPKVAQYQNVHEYLIQIVKESITEPLESNLVHEYMWYASELYKLSLRYTSNALQKEAEAVFVKYLVKGRNEYILRSIANSMGIPLRSVREILAPFGVGVPEGMYQEIINRISNLEVRVGYLEPRVFNLEHTISIPTLTITRPVEIYENYTVVCLGGDVSIQDGSLIINNELIVR